MVQFTQPVERQNEGQEQAVTRANRGSLEPPRNAANLLYHSLTLLMPLHQPDDLPNFAPCYLHHHVEHGLAAPSSGKQPIADNEHNLSPNSPPYSMRWILTYYILYWISCDPYTHCLRYACELVQAANSGRIRRGLAVNSPIVFDRPGNL